MADSARKDVATSTDDAETIDVFLRGLDQAEQPLAPLSAPDEYNPSPAEVAYMSHFIPYNMLPAVALDWRLAEWIRHPGMGTFPIKGTPEELAEFVKRMFPQPPPGHGTTC